MQECKKRRVTGSNYFTVCHAKEKFSSWHKADRVRKKMGRTCSGKVHIYKCPHCRQFHVGHGGPGGHKDKHHGS